MKKNCAAVIVAAGSAQRMQGIDKIMAPLGGVPMILQTVNALSASQKIDRIVVVTRRELLAPVRELCGQNEKLTAVVEGGSDRTQSVQRGIAAVGAAELVAIHDGARPLVTVRVIDDAIDAAASYGAAAPAIAVHDTVKVAKDGCVTYTPDRSTLFAVQTPQVFRKDLIIRALTDAQRNHRSLTDDCSAVELLGESVRLTAGSEENLKITVPLDLAIAETILSRRDAVHEDRTRL